MPGASVYEMLLSNARLYMLDWSSMFNYLAEAGLQHYLALLPKSAELKGQTHIQGELGTGSLDFASLGEPPHQIFVNWSSSPEGILNFTRKYGLLDPTGKYREDALDRRGRGFSIKISSWIEFQTRFRDYWDWNKDHVNWETVKHDLLLELGPEVYNSPQYRHPGIEIVDIWSLGPRPQFQLGAETLWQYFCALLAFHSIGDLRHCQNKDCSAPRFIARRKDQLYCSSDCAALLAKRRWWAKNGEKWRSQRRKTKTGGGKR